MHSDVMTGKLRRIFAPN